MSFRIVLVALWLMCLSVSAQVSYWFSQWQKKPDAKTAQEFFMLPGTNILFTYASNHVIINSSGGGIVGNIQLTGDVLGGPGPSPLATTLKNTGTAGTYTKTTFNAQGLETSGTAAVLASADFQNQGTVTTVLHGNAAGNPSWLAVDLANDVSGDLAVTHLNGGLAAGATTFWRGDGTWASVVAAQTNIYATNLIGLVAGTNIFFTTNGAGDLFINATNQIGSQTPWLTDIDGNRKQLTNVTSIVSSNIVVTNILFAYSVNGGLSSNEFSFFFDGSARLQSNAGGGAKPRLDFNYLAASTVPQLSLTRNTSSDYTFWLFADAFTSPYGQIGLVGTKNSATTYSDDGKVSFGTGLAPATDALVVDQPNAKITTGLTIYSTNGYFYTATNNGVVAGPVTQPLHCWAALMMTNTNTFLMAANTYHRITNFNVARTNLMDCVATNGLITNTIAGFYYCAIHMSGRSLDNSAFVEGELLLNGVQRDEVGFQTQFDVIPRYKGMSAMGILYIPANSQITFQIRSGGASGIEISRAQMVVMPP